MKDLAIWILILAGPVFAFIGMRKHHVPWKSKQGAAAVIAAAITVIAGGVLFLLAQ